MSADGCAWHDSHHEILDAEYCPACRVCFVSPAPADVFAGEVMRILDENDQDMWQQLKAAQVAYEEAMGDGG